MNTVSAYLFRQAVGPLLANPASAKVPERIVLEGRFARLEPLDAKAHGDQLFAASSPADAPARFAYLPEEPGMDRSAFDAWIANRAASSDPLFFAVIDKRTGTIEGRQTLMRIDPANQAIEIGNIYWGPAISRTPVTTEANFLFAQYAFDALGYRRYEWKCNALNVPSRKAALRFGFTYEGHFRRSNIVKGRSRDTSWFSIIDEEWPAIKRGYEAWLSPENFDSQGQQRDTLSLLIANAQAGARAR